MCHGCLPSVRACMQIPVKQQRKVKSSTDKNKKKEKKAFGKK